MNVSGMTADGTLSNAVDPLASQAIDRSTVLELARRSNTAIFIVDGRLNFSPREPVWGLYDAGHTAESAARLTSS